MVKLYQKLEFNLILQQVAKYAANDYVSKQILDLKHAVGYEVVIKDLTNTNEMMALLKSYPDLSFNAFTNINLIIDKLAHPVILDGQELNEIVSFLDLGESLFEYYKLIDHPLNYPYFEKQIHQITNLS
ncbi:MAG: hypothetical protein ACRCTA_01035, partial [Bacilli bacterium]